jgi:hypothetical protein
MFVRINLNTDQIVNFTTFPIESNEFGTVFTIEDGVPIDFNLDKYEYIPSTPGVYDPNGWYPIIPSIQQENSIIRRQWVTVNTSSNGLFTFNFPQDFFTKAPMVSCTVIATNTRVHSVNVRSVTKDSITGVVKRSRLLPSVLSALSSLVSYDVFQDPGVVQVQIKAEEIL